MAKAPPIEPSKCGEAASTTAAAILRTRLDEMLGYREAALASDGVEGVHDMRVASRRFRSLLRDFADVFDKKQLKPVKKDAKRIADALGSVRDEDVAIEALQEIRSRAQTDLQRACVDGLIYTRRDRRDIALAELADEISDQKTKELKDGLAALIDDGIRDDTDLARLNFRQYGSVVIRRSFAEFAEREIDIYEPLNVEALHKLRIAAKRLKYVLQLFDPCFDGRLQPLAKQISKLQAALGGVHDSDSWTESLGRSLDTGRTLDRVSADWLMSQFVSGRASEYAEALDAGNKWANAGSAAELREIIGK